MAGVEWTPSFWLFMAASSFLIVPVVEELTYRGYMLGRLRESFSSGSAVLLLAVLFGLSHTQYLRPDALALGSLVAVVFNAVLWGYATVRMASLIPAMVAHMLVNVPLTPPGDVVALCVGLLALLTFSRVLVPEVRRFAALLGGARDWLGVAIILVFGAVIALTINVHAYAPFGWGAALLALSVASLVQKYRGPIDQSA